AGVLTGPANNLTLTANGGGVMGNSTTGNAATATAFDHTPTGCTNQWATGIAASGNLTCADISRLNGTLLSGLATGILKNTTGTGVPSIAVAGDFPTLNQNTTGNAATATAAQTTPTLCSSGNYARGVDASFNASGCTAAGAGTVVTSGTMTNTAF